MLFSLTDITTLASQSRNFIFLLNIIRKCKKLLNNGVKFFRFCVPLTISSFVFVFYFRADMLVITDKFGPTVAGVYSISLMLFFLTADLMWSQFGKAYTPNLISSWTSNSTRSRSIRQLKDILHVYAITAVLILAGVALLGQTFMTLLFGDNSPWINSAQPLFWLLIGFSPTVGYGLVYRILLIERGPFLYMVISLVIVSVKYLMISLYADSFGLDGIALLSALMMFILFISISVLLSSEARKAFTGSTFLLRSFAPISIIAFGFWLRSINVLLPLSYGIVILLSVLLAFFFNNTGILLLHQIMVRRLFAKKAKL